MELFLGWDHALREFQPSPCTAVGGREGAPTQEPASRDPLSQLEASQGVSPPGSGAHFHPGPARSAHQVGEDAEEGLEAGHPLALVAGHPLALVARVTP